MDNILHSDYSCNQSLLIQVAFVAYDERLKDYLFSYLYEASKYNAIILKTYTYFALARRNELLLDLHGCLDSEL